LERLVSLCKTNGLESQSVNYLLSLAEIHLLIPGEGYWTKALPYIFSAQSLCTKYCLTSLNAVASVLLAEVELRMDNPARARHLIEEVLPYILQNCSTYVQSNTFLVLAECTLAEVTKQTSVTDR